MLSPPCHGVTPELCHRPAANHCAPQCLTKLFPKPVRSTEERLVLPYYDEETLSIFDKTAAFALLFTSSHCLPVLAPPLPSKRCSAGTNVRSGQAEKTNCYKIYRYVCYKCNFYESHNCINSPNRRICAIPFQIGRACERSLTSLRVVPYKLAWARVFCFLSVCVCDVCRLFDCMPLLSIKYVMYFPYVYNIFSLAVGT